MLWVRTCNQPKHCHTGRTEIPDIKCSGSWPTKKWSTTCLWWNLLKEKDDDEHVIGKNSESLDVQRWRRRDRSLRGASGGGAGFRQEDIYFPSLEQKNRKEKKTAIRLHTRFPGQNVRLDSVRGTNEKSGFRAGTLEMFIKEVEKCSSSTLQPCCLCQVSAGERKKGLWRRKQLLKRSPCA